MDAASISAWICATEIGGTTPSRPIGAVAELPGERGKSTPYPTVA